jgi:hypothetical protein
MIHVIIGIILIVMSIGIIILFQVLETSFCPEEFFFSFVCLVLGLTLALVGMNEISYKQGQIDALSKTRILYQLTDKVDGTKIWERIEDGK